MFPSIVVGQMYSTGKTNADNDRCANFDDLKVPSYRRIILYHAVDPVAYRLSGV